MKPDFFKDEDLATLPFECRLLFAGLWNLADKAGYLEYRPRWIKAEIFPYDDIDIQNVIALLLHPKIPERPDKSFIAIVSVPNPDDDRNYREYIHLPTFLKHQRPHHTEAESIVNGELTVKQPLENVLKPEGKERKGKERKGKEPPPTPPAGGSGFEKFWKVYPKKRNKGDAEKAWSVIKPGDELLDTMLTAIAAASSCDSWRKNGGEFIPYPATWLRRRGWEDVLNVTNGAPMRVSKLDKLVRGER